ncbi:hypothetical protein ID866_8722 [Astraeus odoratus]|nr:hypothetical protein ID866_8722 [Astraeus odoratus]
MIGLQYLLTLILIQASHRRPLLNTSEHAMKVHLYLISQHCQDSFKTEGIRSDSIM